jgi:hypothetical protein
VYQTTFALTRALRRGSQRPIKFVPQCLTPSFEDCSFRELIEFTTRQLKITRTYAPHLWKPLLMGSAIFVLVFLGELGLSSPACCWVFRSPRRWFFS